MSLPVPPRSGRRAPPSRVVSFVDRGRLGDALSAWIPDAHDRDFVVRCLLDEGPAHHRGANYALLMLLVELVGAIPAAGGPPAEPMAVPMRMPPHLAEGDEPPAWPVALDLAPLRRIASDESSLDGMIDCLTDGPPQHALANVLMVDLIGAALAALRVPAR